MASDVSLPQVEVARRLGILGGSFDPIHLAHLVVAERVREALALDVVLFAPVSQQPFKTDQSATPAEHRTAMVELAIKGNPHFALTRVDLDRPGPSYTVDTLRQVDEEWGRAGGVEMWFIIGADSLLTFPDWQDPEGILSQARLAVVGRPGSIVDIDALYSRLPGLVSAVDWVESPLLEISATELRRRVAQGRSIRYLVPEEVREYIEEEGLYRGR